MDRYSNSGRTYVLRELFCEVMQIAGIQKGLASIAVLDRLPSIWEWPKETREGALRAPQRATPNKRKGPVGPSNSAVTDITQYQPEGEDIDLEEEVEGETSMSKDDLEAIGSALGDLDGEDDDEMETAVQTWPTMNAEEWNLHGVHMLNRLKNISAK
eukprot:7284911-Prymnesium_polylepis.1